MAIHEQTPNQTTPTRPTPEQATEAQAYFARPEILDIARNAIQHELGEKGVRHFETILAVAKPPTDEEIAQAIMLHEPVDTTLTKDGELRDMVNEPKSWAAHIARIVRHFLGPVKP